MYVCVCVCGGGGVVGGRVQVKVMVLFVCVEVLWPSQSNGVMSTVVSLSNPTFTGQTSSSKQLTSIVCILSPNTDNCPS